ncbi:MAG TPA: FHA domain-containing protein [Polyangia bacterium]|jgi:hypothetical protein|nr:FHA domain-containing protein [Polyangia bacterium]
MEHDSAIDFVQLALRIPRAQFVAQHPYLFLVSQGGLLPVAAKAKTLLVPLEDVTEMRAVRQDQVEEDAPPPLLLAVRKRQPITQGTPPGLISIGRNTANDIVIPDLSVSKVHAHFRPVSNDGQLELHDAGSRNGTWVGKRQVTPKTGAVSVKPGAVVRFGRVEFVVLSAADLWDQVRDVPDW